MANKKKCFVISPIGDDDSDIRKEADALLWVARNALEKFDFDVIRVDQIARSTTITSEIIRLIQECELCLIVLTGHNPNVFYEAGRRHETGRPFIQLSRKGEPLAFDVASIRTIFYDDIQTLASAAKVVEQIQKYVDEFEKGGYGSSGTGVSLSSIAAGLDRIERKVGQLMSSSTSATLPVVDVQPPHSPTGPQELDDVIPGLAAFASASKDPLEEFFEALIAGNVRRAAELLPRIESRLDPKEFTAAAMPLVAALHEPAVEMVLRMLEEHFDKLGEVDDEKQSVIMNAVGGVVRFFCRMDREAEGISRLEATLQRIMISPSLSRTTLAWYKNQWQKLLYGAQRYEDALGIAEEVVELNPNDTAYLYNLSLICGKLNLPQKSIRAIDRLVALDVTDDDHLRRAVEVYAREGRIDDAKKLLAQLRKQSPMKAMLFDEDIRKVLGMRF